MEYHEGDDQGAAGGGGQLCHGGDEYAGHNDGEDDAGLNARQCNAREGDARPEDHAAHHEQGCGVFHDVALAHAPGADGGHGQQVVEAQHGVQQAADEAAVAVAAVGGGGGGGQQEGGGGD